MIPSATRIPASTALRDVEIIRFAPALSPARHITSPVDPTVKIYTSPWDFMIPKDQIHPVLKTVSTH